MKSRIVIISNTCPYAGEVFLQNELHWIPEQRNATIFPILLKNHVDRPIELNDHIEVSTAATCPTKADLFIAAVKSPWSLIRHGEWEEVFRHEHGIHNLAKALKFAYVSESRARRIRRWLKQNCPDEQFLFYSYWLYECAFVAARLHQMFPGSHFVSRCHGFDLYEERHRGGYLPYREYLMRTADMICPISQDGKNYLSALYQGKWDQKIRVMRLGTENCGINPERNREPFTAVSCSNLVSVKRVDRIISALKKAHQNIRWYHFGDGALRPELEMAAQKLPENVEYKFMGQVPNNRVMQFYCEKHVDAFINVSSSEGVPVSIMEALSYGIPVIATDVGGTHEIVEHGVNGFLLPKDFCDIELLGAIDLLQASCEELDMRKSAREIWARKCSAVENYSFFYQSLSELEEFGDGIG